jgi:monoterpene epsilon-lactone hydrolase
MAEIDEIRALLASRPRPVGWDERRRRIEEVGSLSGPGPDILLEPTDLDGVPGEWSSAPGSDPGRVLLFFHGGGFCSGSLKSHRRLVTEAGRAAGIRTLAVGYRLAPEHPFPAAYEDALTAWRALIASGVSPGDVVVGGDSAGGGLAVALINRLFSLGGEGPRCAWLLSPWTDLTQSGETLATKDAVDPLIHKAYLEELAAAYVPVDLDRRDPRVSILFADKKRLPPVLVQVGSDETLLADSTRFVTSAGAANVRITLEVWPGMIHAFPLWNAQLSDGRRALQHAGRFIRETLGLG